MAVPFTVPGIALKEDPFATLTPEQQKGYMPTGGGFATHIRKHMAQSDGSGMLDHFTIGGKFPREAKADPSGYAKKIDVVLRNVYAAAVEKGEVPGVVILEGKLERPGKNALTKIEPGQSFIELVRDPGTQFETVKKIIPVPDQAAMPDSDRLVIIAGPLDSSGYWGGYTAFVGETGERSPSPDQTPEARARSEAFWADHGFYATPEEIRYALSEMRRVAEKSEEKKAVYAPMIEAGEKALARFEKFKGVPFGRVVETVQVESGLSVGKTLQNRAGIPPSEYGR